LKSKHVIVTQSDALVAGVGRFVVFDLPPQLSAHALVFKFKLTSVRKMDLRHLCFAELSLAPLFHEFCSI
jgi:hypothetical protein